MFMVSDQWLCRSIHVKKYSSSTKLCILIYRHAILSSKYSAVVIDLK